MAGRNKKKEGAETGLISAGSFLLKVLCVLAKWSLPLVAYRGSLPLNKV